MKNRSSAINQLTVTYFALLVLGICAAVASLEIPRDPNGSLGARVFPIMASVTLIILGILGILGGVSQIKGRINAETEKSTSTSFFKVAALLILSIFYVWTMSTFGYLVSTALISPLILLLFGIRNPVGLLIAAIVCPAVYHAIFFMGLECLPALWRMV